MGSELAYIILKILVRWRLRANINLPLYYCTSQVRDPRELILTVSKEYLQASEQACISVYYVFEIFLGLATNNRIDFSYELIKSLRPGPNAIRELKCLK